MKPARTGAAFELREAEHGVFATHGLIPQRGFEIIDIGWQDMPAKPQPELLLLLEAS